MKSFESNCRELVRQPNFWLKMFIGIFIAVIPFANILAFGYIGRAIRENGSNADFILPRWDLSVKNLKQNLLIGLNEIALLLIFLGGPIAIGYAMGAGLFWISHSMRLLLAYCGLLVGVPAAAYAMLCAKNVGELAAVKTVWSMFSKAIGTYKHVGIPSFLFLCLLVLDVQLFPAATLGAPMFFGLIFVVAFMRNLKIVCE
ncbi:MAG: hypothetical protein LBD33_02665 [Puniceicoccales bacterium]|jgi:hypothetical protein|nr:hypothetical protein [Puniceicoccales bacterium]